jgi:type II secretory pathway pseudopilin PulG
LGDAFPAVQQQVQQQEQRQQEQQLQQQQQNAGGGGAACGVQAEDWQDGGDGVYMLGDCDDDDW